MITVFYSGYKKWLSEQFFVNKSLYSINLVKMEHSESVSLYIGCINEV